MRHISRLLAVSVIVVTACGQVEPVLLRVGMPECSYQGPSTMSEGEASLSLTLNGLGRARVLLVELTEGHTYDELVSHFESSEEWLDRPDWIYPVLDVELDDAEGVDGKSEKLDLEAGEYAVVCVDRDNETVEVASPLQVRDG